MSPIKISLLKLTGHICVALGVVGAFLPLLPTTPFLLLASACYIRASERHYRWLMENRYLGPYLRDYREKRGIRPGAKAAALFFLWGSLAFSMYRVDILILRIILGLIGITVTILILRIRTLWEKPNLD